MKQHYVVYQMSANLYANGVLADSDRMAAFEYDHGRASGSSVTLFHTVDNIKVTTPRLHIGIHKNANK